MFLLGGEGRRAYGCGVGIEIWAVIALITVLSVYLLPLLVGRREMARRSNVQDRYSAELRVLATGAAAVERDDTCANSGHAELFRRRPEVRVMNRPAVRNVRALRTERELDRARQVHAQGRERRRVAASHRGIVASVLLGVTLGAWGLGLVTALPWWPALLPSALLGASMVAGRRAALASAAADRRERRRIAELEQTLVTLTGRRSSASVVAAPRSVANGARSASSGAGAVSTSAASPAVSAVSAESVEAACDSGAQDSFIERLTREGAQRPAARSVSAESAGSTESAVSAEPVAGSPSEATGTTAARPSRAVDSEEERLARLDADLDDETAAAIAAEREATRRASVYVPSRHAGRVTRDMGVREAVSRDGDEESSPRTKDFVASLPASTSRSLSGWGKLFAEASAIEQEAQERAAAAPSPQVAAEPARRAADSAPQAVSRTASEPAPTVARPQAPAAAAPAATEGVVKEEATTSTPPQGWRPVHVPAPTYTLAARAPRRSYADPVVDPGTSAPVPARPQSARAYIPAPVEDEEELFHPIDLDAILEGRRAAGE